MEEKRKEEIIEEIEKLAYKYEQDFGGCSQAVVGAFKKALERISDDVFKASTGLAGGVGLTGNTCGALLGGVLVLSTFLGREYNNFADPKGIRFETFKLAKKLVERYEAEYGSPKCENVMIASSNSLSSALFPSKAITGKPASRRASLFSAIPTVNPSQPLL